MNTITIYEAIEFYRRSVDADNDYIVIPNDAAWLAQLLPVHHYCDTAHRGHQSCVDDATRLLAAMRGAA